MNNLEKSGIILELKKIAQQKLDELRPLLISESEEVKKENEIHGFENSIREQKWKQAAIIYNALLKITNS